jgi:hypothetical protein
MPNILAPNGFDQYAGAEGTPNNFGLIAVKISSSDTTKIYAGDPVKRLASGYVTQWTPGTAASFLVGIFVTCKYFSVGQGNTISNNFWPGADAAGDVTAYLIPIAASVPARFKVQVSGASPLTLTHVGNNIDVAIGTGNNANGRSGATVNYATVGTTATLPFTIVGLFSDVAAQGSNGVDNASVNNIVLVQANEMQQTGI